MGLDMFLHKDYYVKNWDHEPPEEKWEITITKGGKPFSIPTEKITTVRTQEIYWRKANAVHRWFVENVQGDVDECRESPVEPSQLRELLVLCNEVLADHKKALELLPTMEGFFFGSTDYDEYYFQDIAHTKAEIERVLKEHETVAGYCYFVYESSW